MSRFTRRDRIRTWFNLIAGALVLAAAPARGTAQEADVPAAPATGLAWPEMVPVETRTLDSGLVIEDIVIGEGPPIEIGTWPSVHYRAMTTDNVVFVDSLSNDPPVPYQFFMTAVAMEGWVQGLPGMRVGGVRRLIIPSELSYRDLPPPNTPVQPGDTVIFDFLCTEIDRLPNANLGNDVTLRVLRDGEGEPARYGDWITFHMKVFSDVGADETVGMNTHEPDIGPFQAALPCPPGLFTGRRVPKFNMPYFDMILYGMRVGERRDVAFPTSEFFGPMGEPRLGIGANVPWAVEFECVAIDRGPEITLDSGIRLEDLKVGDGRYAHLGENVVFRYRGTLEDGTVIDTNWDDPEPMNIRLFQNRIIAGVRLGIQGMRVGGVRKLYIPPEFAFGSAPPDDFVQVPPNANVIYEVELVDVFYPRPGGPS